MRNKLIFLGNLRSGEPVFDRPTSHLHESVLGILPEALSEISRGEPFFVREVDFGRLVGETNCVATSGSDVVCWAQRPNRQGLTRFVKIGRHTSELQSRI